MVDKEIKERWKKMGLGADSMGQQTIGPYLVSMKPEPKWHYKNPYKWIYNHYMPIKCWVLHNIFNVSNINLLYFKK